MENTTARFKEEKGKLDWTNSEGKWPVNSLNAMVSYKDMKTQTEIDTNGDGG